MTIIVIASHCGIPHPLATSSLFTIQLIDNSTNEQLYISSIFFQADYPPVTQQLAIDNPCWPTGLVEFEKQDRLLNFLEHAEFQLCMALYLRVKGCLAAALIK